MNIDRAITDVFDFIASTIGKLTASKNPETPDVTGIDISRLITDEELGNRALFYAQSDDVPDVDFSKIAQLPLLSIWEGRYGSPLETVFPENNTVRVRHFRLDGRRGSPVIVMLNGLHVDAAFDAYFSWWALRFAAWGLETAMVTLPYSQQRAPADSYSGQYLMLPETNWTMMALKQSFMDMLLFVNWLKANGAGPVGTFGVSYGALLSGVYACNADNADFAVMCMPPVDISDLLAKWEYADEWRAREAKGEVTLLSDPRIPELMSLCRQQPRMPAGKVFIASGEFDHLVPIETVRAADRAWGGIPWLRVYPTGHINTFALNLRLVNDMRRFLKREILQPQ